jgi:NADPH-dependent curcumin reductase CurA
MEGTEVRLTRRPVGFPTLEDFELVRVEVPEPAAGEVLVRNRLISFDPGVRLWIQDFGLPMPQVPVGSVLPGEAIGEVIASGSAEVPVGALVRHQLSWREYAAAPAAAFRMIDESLFPRLSMHFGFAMTAYVGLVDVAGMRAGDTVFVSSAAGSVGSQAGQIARLKGAKRVIGSAGSAAKVAYVTGELGFDAAFDHHDGPPADRLRELAPDGIDVYFDNVGGEQLEAAIDAMRPGGRIVLCGAMSQQGGDGAPAGVRNLLQVIGKGLTLRGFTVFAHAHRFVENASQLSAWAQAGELHYAETEVRGLEQAPAAFLGLLRGDHMGRVVVTLQA